MISSKDRELDKIAKELDSINAGEALGKLIIHLINSNKEVSNSINKLIKSLEISSSESTKINKSIMYLTVVITTSSLIIGIIATLSFLI